MSRWRPPAAERGFSLLEVVVAFSIMGLALGVLYQSLGGSIRGVGVADRQVRAVLVAESLLAGLDAVPRGGLAREGRTADGFAWRLASVPYPLVTDTAPPWLLQRVEVEVRWDDRGGARTFRLTSLRPEVEVRQ